MDVVAGANGGRDWLRRHGAPFRIWLRSNCLFKNAPLGESSEWSIWWGFAMSMGRRKSEIQNEFWVHSDKLESKGHAFFERLNKALAASGFDEKLEELCAPY